MDGDGHLDLVAGGHTVLLNRGDGTFSAAVSTMGSGGAFAVGDLNGDGVVDLAVLNHARGVSVLVGLGKGTTSLAANYAAPSGDSVSIALGDLNGDGRPDLVGAFNGWVAVLVNASPEAIVVRDVNGGHGRRRAVGGRGHRAPPTRQVTHVAIGDAECVKRACQGVGPRRAWP
jgi:hypothetical protein